MMKKTFIAVALIVTALSYGSAQKSVDAAIDDALKNNNNAVADDTPKVRTI